MSVWLHADESPKRHFCDIVPVLQYKFRYPDMAQFPIQQTPWMYGMEIPEEKQYEYLTSHLEYLLALCAVKLISEQEHESTAARS